MARAAAKKAKQMELQRHVRHIKQVRTGKGKQEEDMDALEAYLMQLKNIDTQWIADRALLSKLTKSKLLPKANRAVSMQLEDTLEATYPLYAIAKEEGLVQDSESAPDAPLNKLQHQLQSAKVLAETVNHKVQSIVLLLRPPTIANKKETEKEQAEQNLVMGGMGEKMSAELSGNEPGVPDSGADYSSDDGFDDETQVKKSEGIFRDLDMDMDAMVAPGSDDDDDDDDDDDNDNDIPSNRKRLRDSSSDEEYASNILPSLATGFVPAKRDDDWSDAEADYADKTSTKSGPPQTMRKNRRGQRERRA
ncbi:hypothetical protein MVES_000414 [Malassezia vespertilionis]|uniref:Bud22 domain-containing protein n=2 Tax=Malassezia vespertilionis TaxID=2020962 RepID=A0A2N1JHH6_9BASI|nr:hypothetical protein MVES_000414 [Malassezia vespertilionis]